MSGLTEFYQSIDVNLLEQPKHARNRLLLDSIDNIYKKESMEIEENINTIAPDILGWARKNEIPANPNCTFFKRKRKIKSDIEY